MKLHPRHTIVRMASHDVEAALWEAIRKHDLTYVETLQVLNSATGGVLRYALRDERHPDDPDKAGDEL